MQFVYGNLCINLYEKRYPMTLFRMLDFYIERLSKFFSYCKITKAIGPNQGFKTAIENI